MVGEHFGFDPVDAEGAGDGFGGDPVDGIPVAAGVLYPVFGVLLSPMIAAAAMALSSVSVITNALRLRTQHLG